MAVCLFSKKKNNLKADVCSVAYKFKNDIKRGCFALQVLKITQVSAKLVFVAPGFQKT